MKTEKCGCVYEGPIQVIVCPNPEHNVAAKNVNRAQVMIAKTELSNIRLTLALQKMIDCKYECACPGDHGCMALDEAEALLRKEGQVAHEKMASTVEELDSIILMLGKRVEEMDKKRELLVTEIKLCEEKKGKLQRGEKVE